MTKPPLIVRVAQAEISIEALKEENEKIKQELHRLSVHVAKLLGSVVVS